MAKRETKKKRNQVSDLVKAMSPEIDPAKMSDDAMFRLLTAINQQAVNDADRILHEMQKKPNDMITQLKLRDVISTEIVPFFCSDLCFANPREMMGNIIKQRMRKDGIAEMPECWASAMEITDEVAYYLGC